MPVIINDLSKFSRSELIDIIADYQENEKRLNKKIAELEEELSSRLIIKEECGSIAEAALSINKIFETSQAAADQYYESIKVVYDMKLQELEKKAQEEIDQKIKAAEEEATKIISEAKDRAQREMQEINLKIDKLCEANPGLSIKRMS